VWDPDVRWTISEKNQQSKAGYCPLEGMEARGKAGQVYLRGQLVAENGQLVKEHAGIYQKRGTYQKC